MTEITQDERALLEWLGKEYFSQYGECHGKMLNSLIAKGLAQLHGDRGELGSFIARGAGPLYQSVSLTQAGRTAIAENKRLAMEAASSRAWHEGKI